MSLPRWARFSLACLFLALGVAHLLTLAITRDGAAPYNGWWLGAFCGIVALMLFVSLYPGRAYSGHTRSRK